MQKLNGKLCNASLRIAEWKGKYSALKRYVGADSNSAWESEEDRCSSQAGHTDEEVEQEEEEEEGEASSCAEPLRDASKSPGLEVGDIVEISGLLSEKGMQLNHKYAKVQAWHTDTQRFEVLVGKGKILVKPDNLMFNARPGDMSAFDEELLLKSEPTLAHVRSLPWIERMQRLGYLDRESTSSSSALRT